MHKKKKTKLYSLILMSMILSLGFVKILTPRIFIANSPKLNPDFMASIRKSPSAVFAYITNIQEGATLKDHLETAKIPRTNPPPGLNFLPVAKGVYAAEDPESGKKYVKIEKGTKLKKQIVQMPDGSVNMVYIPVN